MLKFSLANAKLRHMKDVPGLAVWLSGKVGRKSKKIYSLDLLSGWSCPFAKECLSKVVVQADGRKKVRDGLETLFRCFSASQEALYPLTYNLRKHNFDSLRACKTGGDMARLIGDSLPDDAGIVRIHVGGDFFNEAYFKAWVQVARNNPHVLFYAYTKSLRYWLANKNLLPDNFVLTASYGGREDHLIEEHGLRHTVVIADIEACEKIREENLERWNGLEIDHDDSHAANPDKRYESFNLLIHGSQPAGSNASKAASKLKGRGSYNRKD